MSQFYKDTDFVVPDKNRKTSANDYSGEAIDRGDTLFQETSAVVQGVNSFVRRHTQRVAEQERKDKRAKIKKDKEDKKLAKDKEDTKETYKEWNALTREVLGEAYVAKYGELRSVIDSSLEAVQTSAGLSGLSDIDPESLGITMKEEREKVARAIGISPFDASVKEDLKQKADERFALQQEAIHDARMRGEYVGYMTQNIKSYKIELAELGDTVTYLDTHAQIRKRAVEIYRRWKPKDLSYEAVMEIERVTEDLTFQARFNAIMDGNTEADLFGDDMKESTKEGAIKVVKLMKESFGKIKKKNEWRVESLMENLKASVRAGRPVTVDQINKEVRDGNYNKAELEVFKQQLKESQEFQYIEPEVITGVTQTDITEQNSVELWKEIVADNGGDPVYPQSSPVGMEATGTYLAERREMAIRHSDEILAMRQNHNNTEAEISRQLAIQRAEKENSKKKAKKKTRIPFLQSHKSFLNDGKYFG